MQPYQVIVLQNGMRVLLYPQEHVHSVSVLAMIRAGHLAETPQNNGVAHLLEHMIFDGTKEYPSYKALSNKFDLIAGEYGASTSYEKISIGGSFVDEEITNALEVLNQLMFEPLLKESFLKKEQGIVFDELTSYEDSNSYQNFLISTKNRFNDGTILSLPLGGTSATIKERTLEQVQNFHRKYFRPDNVSLIIAGNIDSNDIQGNLENIFTQKPSNQPLEHQAFRAEQFSDQLVAVNGKPAQKAYIHITFPSYSWKTDSKKRVALSYLSALLAERKDSLLFGKLREELGWIYDINSSYFLGFDLGIFEIVTSCPPDKSLDVIKATLEAIDRVKTKQFSDEYLEKVKDIDRKRIKMTLDTTDSIVNWFSSEIFYRYPKIYLPDDFLKIYQSISVDDIQAVAQDILDLQKINISLLQDMPAEKELICKNNIQKFIS